MADPVTRPRGGRIAKRTAILDAALLVFARDGFDRASMEEIARTAEVAKPTLYNHFADKKSLFGAALEEYAARSGTQVLDVLDELDLTATDLRSELERVGYALLGCLNSASGRAVIRLQNSEETRFPDLIGDTRQRGRRRTVDALSGKLARLALAGRLRTTDPDLAARHFLALVFDEAVETSRGGHRAPSEADLARSVRDGIGTFLAAFGAEQG